MTPIRSPTAKASSWSWVTNSAVVPACLRMARSSWASRSRRSTSRLEKGSSSSSSRGLGASARASAMRCCWPPDSWCGARLAACARPTRSSTSCVRWRRCARAAGGGCRSRRWPPRSGAGTARSPGTPCRCAAPRATDARRWRRRPAPRRRCAMRPAASRSRPATARSSEVLPQPEGPISTPISPRRRPSETASTAARAVWPG